MLACLLQFRQCSRQSHSSSGKARVTPARVPEHVPSQDASTLRWTDGNGIGPWCRPTRNLWEVLPPTQRQSASRLGQLRDKPWTTRDPLMGPKALSGPQGGSQELTSKREPKASRCCRCSARPWMGPMPPKEPHGGRENAPANGGGLAKYCPSLPGGARVPKFQPE